MANPLGQRKLPRVQKPALAQVFSFEFRETSKNTFFTEHLRTTASPGSQEKLAKTVFL